ncbi:MAG: trigger factor [Alphaproteobacteria bacterium]
MLVTETRADGLKREFTVVVDAQDIENRIQGRLQKLTQTVRMPGFRPGKVPASLLRKQFGDSIRGEILEEAVNQSSAQALAEKGVRPAIRPKIEVVRFDEGADLEYTMAVELMPDIVPADFRKIKLVRETAEAAEADVDATVERLAAREKNFVPVEAGVAAVKGDALLIDFIGKIDGVPFEGGSSTDHVLELGSSTFIEGFEDRLIGAKAGDHVSLNVTFPKEYVNDELAGRDAVFEVDVKEIQKVDSVPVDDAFAQSHGFSDLAAMGAAVREQIERDYAAVSRAKLKRALLDALAEQHEFPVPEGMVDIEFDAIWKRVKEDMAEDRLDPDDVGRSEEELRDEYRVIAERRVRLGLLLSEVGRLNNISVEQDEINRAIMERARAFPGQENAVIGFYRQNPEALNELRAPLFEDKVVDFILEMADIDERKVSVAELMRDPEPAETAAKGAEKAAAKPAKKPGKKPAKKAAKSAAGESKPK